MARQPAGQLSGRLPAPAFQAVFVAVRFAADAAVSLAVPAAAYFFRFYVTPSGDTPPTQANYQILSLIFAATNLYFFIVFGTYRPVRGRSIIDENFGVIKVVTLSTFILLACTFFLTRFFYSRLTVVYAMLFGYIFIGASRGLILVIERAMLRRGHGMTRLLIVGTGTHFKSLCEKIAERPDLGMSLIGYLEESPSGDLSRVPLLGGIDELEKIIVHYDIAQVIVTLRPGRGAEVSAIVDTCDRHNAECYVSPDLQQLIVGSHKIDEIAGIPVIRIRGLRLSGAGLFIKRASDIVFSIIIMIFILPFLVLLAIIIKIDSPGPIFYMQKRVGLDGKEFWMYKFRSMRTGAEGREGPAWSQNEDPRITRLGFILRKLSIDELPQIFNVISGEMSLIGPRPERPYFVEQFEKDVPRYMQRHRVKAGMSGWAQVNGLRGDTSIEERVQYDLYYIENWSFWFDIKIMILTAVDIFKEVPRVVKGLKKKEPPATSGSEKQS